MRTRCVLLVLLSLILLLSAGCQRPAGNVAQNAPQQVTPRRETPRVGVAVDTPEKVFAAYSAALAKGDWKRAYSHLTPEYRNFYLFELAFGLGMIGKEDLIAEHQDPEKLAGLKGVEGLDEKKVMKLLVDSFKDKEAFYRAAMEVVAEDERDEFPDGKLRSVKFEGQRARGTTTRYLDSIHTTKDGVETRHREAYQSPVYFKKVDGGWRIDMPSPEEESRDLESADAE